MKCLITAVCAYFVVGHVFTDTPVNNATAKYDPAELLRKIFNTSDSVLSRATHGIIQFESEIPQPDLANYNQENNIENAYYHENNGKFENEYENTYNKNIQNVKFVDESEDGTRKKKRRKRKPKQHYGLQSSGNVLPYPGNNAGPYDPYGEQYYYRPHRPRPGPSFASEALSAVTGALTSIAMYDDYQCVPRLLCEAAAGGGLGSSGILQTVSGLQPLLTLLSAYSGLTSNPLFVFGRAVLLGASDGNAATCRYAYSYCPTDPEQLVHYLNNHNGGFFRFFNAPQHGQQNVEQFYNQLSQNYGLREPNQDFDQNTNHQNYGLINNQQNYGFQNPGLYSDYNQNYGLAYPYQNYNHDIRFKNNVNGINVNKIEKRIQNKPHTLNADLEEDNLGWTFPEETKNTPVSYVNKDIFNSYISDSNYENNKEINHYNDYNDRNQFHTANRKGKKLKFPGFNNEEDLQSNYDKNREAFFPEQENNQNLDHNPFSNDFDDKRQFFVYNTDRNPKKYFDNRQYLDENLHSNKYNDRDVNYGNQYYINKYNDRSRYKYSYNNDLKEGVQTVYVVRGDGDPNKPEVYKLRPGEKVQ